LRVRLREVMHAYSEKTGRRMTYDVLAADTGLSVTSLQSLGSRRSYNTTLTTIERICVACQCTPGELLTLESDPAECP
jgi:DNA-binding Xre family transcriptional regulator